MKAPALNRRHEQEDDADALAALANSIVFHGWRKELAARHARFEAAHDAWLKAAGLAPVARISSSDGRTICLDDAHLECAPDISLAAAGQPGRVAHRAEPCGPDNDARYGTEAAAGTTKQ